MTTTLASTTLATWLGNEDGRIKSGIGVFHQIGSKREIKFESFSDFKHLSELINFAIAEAKQQVRDELTTPSQGE